MAETMIMAGGTWIALRKLRSIQATPATPADSESLGEKAMNELLDPARPRAAAVLL